MNNGQFIAFKDLQRIWKSQFYLLGDIKKNTYFWEMGNSASTNTALIAGITTGAVLLSSGFAGLSLLFYSRLNQATRLENLEGKYKNSDFEQLNAELDSVRYISNLKFLNFSQLL